MIEKFKEKTTLVFGYGFNDVGFNSVEIEADEYILGANGELEFIYDQKTVCIIAPGHWSGVWVKGHEPKDRR